MHDWLTVLRTARFRAFWSGLLVSNLGNWCVIAALPILVAARFGAGEELVISLGLRMLPKALLAPVAGAMLRRHGAMRVASRCLAGNGVLTAALPWCPDFLVLQLLIGAIGTLDVFVTPGVLSLRAGATPQGQEMAGNTLCSVADRLAKIVGPALGAGLLLAGFAPAFALFGLATLLAGLRIATLPIPDPVAVRETFRPWGQVGSFARMLRQDGRLSGLLVAAITYMVMLGGLRPFLFWANRDWYGAPDQAWAGLLAAQGMGALVGALLSAVYARRLLARLDAYGLTLLTGIAEGMVMLGLLLAGTTQQAMVILALAAIPEILSTAAWFTAFQQRLSAPSQVVFLSFAAPLWDLAYMAGVAAGGLHVAGWLPLSGYWATVTLFATLPLLVLLALPAARRSGVDA